MTTNDKTRDAEHKLDAFLADFDEAEQERILRYALDHIVPKLKRAALASTPAQPPVAAVPDGAIGLINAAVASAKTQRAAQAEALQWLSEIEAIQGGRNGPTIRLRAAIESMLATPTPAPAAQGEPHLTVWCGSMPESNGKENWTVILRRKGERGESSAREWHKFTSGITFYRSEYKDRARYEADRLRHLIGELGTEPDILAYDADLRSAYVERAEVRPTVLSDEQRQAIAQSWRGRNWSVGDIIDAVEAAHGITPPAADSAQGGATGVSNAS